MRSFTASANDAGVRLSRFVLHVTSGLPNALLYKSFRNKRIKVNGKRATPEQRLEAGDRVELYINDEFFDRPSKPGVATENVSLPTFGVVYEDENIAILQKPAGILSHRDEKGHPALLDAFIQRQVQRGEYDPAAENTFAPALCNRLDRGTEGLLAAAKNYPTLRDMNALIQSGALHKFYRCITLGVPCPGLYEGWLVRDFEAKQVQVGEHAPCAGGGKEKSRAKQISTEVSVVETAGRLALCEVELHTGRTHQIRAHLASMGTPLLGDMKYGDAAANRHYGQKGQALCAWRLVLDAELPSENCLAYLAGKSFEAESAALPCLWAKLKGG